MARPASQFYSLAIAALLSACGSTLYAQDGRLQLTRVKPADPEIRRVVLDGYSRSAVMRALVDEIQTASAMVTIQFGMCATGRIRSCVSNVQDDGRTRHIRIKVNTRTTDDRLIATVAHELQHALEIVRNPEAIDEGSTLALYRRIGTGDCRFALTDKCESEAAVNVERRVLGELSLVPRQ